MASHPPTLAYRYRIATAAVETHRSLPELDALGMGLPPPSAPLHGHEGTPAALRSAPQAQAFGGVAYVGSAHRELHVWHTRRGYELNVAGVGEFTVSAGPRCQIEPFTPVPSVDDATVRETVLGPPLMLACALQGVWCLHASAVLIGGSANIFVGESGRGKSTLAAHLGRSRVCQRIADDVLPVTLSGGRLLCWPRFPQLKLPTTEQYGKEAPEPLPVRGVYALDSATPGVESPLLSQTAGAQQLLRHSVAARCFGPALLAQHLAFCVQAAKKVAVRRLSYPRRFDVLPSVLARVQAHTGETEVAAGAHP